MAAPAIAAMTAELAKVGNPSSLHASGRASRRVVEESREAIADALGARPSDIIFTGSGTEANNLAVKGLFWSARARDPQRTRVLASAVEHHAVLDPVEWLGTHEGAEVSWLPVDSTGRVDLGQLQSILEEHGESIALISVMMANNEVGTIQPIAAITELAARWDIPVHSDAVQAFGKLPIDFSTSGLSAMTVTAHKIGGPMGIAALALRRGVAPIPLIHGGGQERDVRSGTLDAPAAAGFAAAARWAVARQEQVREELEKLRHAMVEGVLSRVDGVMVNGADSPEDRLPGLAHFTFAGAEGDALLLLLDANGVECSTGSACSAGVPRPSHVLIAMGLSEQQARSSLRFSLGHTSTIRDVEALLDALAPAVTRARLAGQS
jgi:cysteine desulfurase